MGLSCDTLLCRGIRIVSAAAGEKHSVALGSHGCLYTWGCGRHGQLGLENVADFVALNMAAPVAVHQPQRVSSLDPNHLDPWDRCGFLLGLSIHDNFILIRFIHMHGHTDSCNGGKL